MNTLENILYDFMERGFSGEINEDFLEAVFTRTVERNCTQKLIIEDHRWEKTLPDYDTEKDVGDWLIFSCLIDDERDYFGHYVETQYPLTLSEYSLIATLIDVLEAKQLQKYNE